MVESHDLDVRTERFLQIGDGGLFGLAFAVGRDIRQARGEAAEVGVGDQFDGQWQAVGHWAGGNVAPTLVQTMTVRQDIEREHPISISRYQP